MSSKIVKAFRAAMMGAPGSGKGTISDRIIKNFNIVHISTGDVLRKNIDEKTKLGIDAEKYINQGVLVPDDMMINCILDELTTYKGPTLLDGFPRTLNQAEKLWAITQFNCVLNLRVPYEIIIDRVKHRYVHKKSGRVYNLEYNPPKVPFKDDITSEPLEKRTDDDPEILRKRLKLYDEKTVPVLEFYKSKGILHEFSGKTSDEIWPQIKQYLATQID